MTFSKNEIRDGKGEPGKLKEERSLELVKKNMISLGKMEICKVYHDQDRFLILCSKTVQYKNHTHQDYFFLLFKQQDQKNFIGYRKIEDVYYDYSRNIIAFRKITGENILLIATSEKVVLIKENGFQKLELGE